LFPPLYAILDPSLLSVPPLAFAAPLARAGVKLMQLRDKRTTPRSACAAAQELIAGLSGQGIRIIVNDRPDIAALADAGGVHVGQQDVRVEDARRICGESRWVGVSTHNVEQFREAVATSADYIAVGPIFPTTTKKNPDPVVGLEFLRASRRLTRKPLVAIGGISLETAAEVFRAGADSVAVIGDLLLAPDPVDRAREYLAIAARVRSSKA
jgi:thiamine-phosphate pyrophosphorylase